MGSLAAYWRFQDAVARAQLKAWLPVTGRVLVDISGPESQTAQIAAMAGHRVLRVLPPGQPGRTPGDQNSSFRETIADLPSLSFLADGCADGVIAEGRTLSLTLVAEELVAEISRVLRPSGRVLACVDSLVFGMAVLAEHQHWPELADLPQAEVVLVPWPDGTITRCYGTDQLRELFMDNGLDIAWIRPRTVLAAKTVNYLLHDKHTSLTRLVETELHARSDDSVGTQLVVSARKPLTVPAVVLPLAADTPRRIRPGLETPIRHRLPAVDAPPVRPVLDPGEGRGDLSPLRRRLLQQRLAARRLRQPQPGVRGVGGGDAAIRGVFTSQHHDGPVQVVANFL
jgi:SAM-dependent methyltransferase